MATTSPLAPRTCCASPSWPLATARSTAMCAESSHRVSHRSTATMSGDGSCRRYVSPRSGKDWPPGPPPKRTEPRHEPGPVTPHGKTPRLRQIPPSSPPPPHHFLRPLSVTVRQSRQVAMTVPVSLVSLKEKPLLQQATLVQVRMLTGPTEVCGKS